MIVNRNPKRMPSSELLSFYYSLSVFSTKRGQRRNYSPSYIPICIASWFVQPHSRPHLYTPSAAACYKQNLLKYMTNRYCLGYAVSWGCGGYEAMITIRDCSHAGNMTSPICLLFQRKKMNCKGRPIWKWLSIRSGFIWQTKPPGIISFLVEVQEVTLGWPAHY